MLLLLKKKELLKLYRKFAFLLCSYIAIFLASCGADSITGAPTVVEPWNSYAEAENSAKAELLKWKESLKQYGDYRNYNFSGLDEIDKAIIGNGYRVFNIYYDALKAYTSHQSIRSLITSNYFNSSTDTGTWEFPILVDGTIVTTLRVFYVPSSNGQESSWGSSLYPTGRSFLFVTDVESKLPLLLSRLKVERIETFFVPLPALATEMMLVTTDAGEYVALSSSAQVFWLEDKDFYTPDEIMPALQKEIGKIIPNIVDVSSDRSHSSGYCSYANAERTAGEQLLTNLTFFYKDDGFHFRAIFGDTTTPDQITMGEGYRLVDINFKAYEPHKTVQSVLYSNDCFWKFALYHDKDIKSDLTNVYNEYEFETQLGWGGDWHLLFKRDSICNPDVVG